jgi:hypothetical protein
LLWVTTTPPVAQAAFLIALVLFHLWTEQHSLSAFIQSHDALRKLDSIIGVRS